MPVDTSIYQMLGHGVTPIKSPQEQELAAQQMRQMRAQTSLLETQQLGAAQTQADTDLLKTTAQNVLAKAQSENRQPEPLEFARAFRATGTVAGIKAAREAETAYAADSKVQLDAKISEITVAQHQLDAVSQITGGILSLAPEKRADAWVGALKTFAQIDPKKGAELAQQYPDYPGDAVIEAKHATAQSEKLRLQQAQAQQLKEHQDRTATEQERHNKEAEVTARIQANKPPGMVVVERERSAAMAGFDASKPLDNPAAEAIAHTHGSWEKVVPDAALNTRATLDQQKMVARAEWLAKNQYGHDSGLPGVSDISLMQESRNSFGPNGVHGKTILAATTATRHLSFLENLGIALANNDNLLVNKLKKEWSEWTGLPAPTNYAAASAMIVPEILKVAKGVGVIGEKEEERLLKANSNISSPAQMKGFINTMAHLMGDRLQTLAPAYASANRGKSIASAIDAEGLKLMAKYGINLPPVGGKAGSEAPKTPPPVTTAVKTATLADGSKVQLSADGKSWEPVK